MKGVFWNCNGLGDLKKFKFLSDLTLENNLDFIALSEMGRGDCTQVFLKNLCGGKDFLWHVKPPRGRSGGMVGSKVCCWGLIFSCLILEK